MISQNFSGHIITHTDWPCVLRNKGVFFVKREPEPLPKENFLNFMTCGDIHPNALDHFCAWVEEVIAPILKLEANLHKFPQCIADDIKRQVHELSTSVYQIRGYIKGRTLLPFPQVCCKYELYTFLQRLQSIFNCSKEQLVLKKRNKSAKNPKVKIVT